MLSQSVSKIIAKIERISGIDMRYLLSGGFWITFGQVVSAFTGFLLTLLLANTLDKVTYGTYKFILSLASLFSILTLPNMNLAIMQATARGIPGVTVAGTRERMYWASIGAIIPLGVAVYYFIQGNPTLSIALVLVAVTLPFFDTFSTFSAYLQGRERFREYTYANIGIHVASVFALAATALVIPHVLVLITVYLCVYALLRYGIYRITVPRESADPTSVKETVTYGRHLGVMSVLGLIASNIDQILLFHFLGPVEVAVYSIAISVPEQMRSVLRNVGTVAGPRFARHNTHSLHLTIANLWRKSFFFLASILTIIILYILAAPLFYSIFFPTYADAITFSQIFAISLVGSITAVPLSLLQSQQKTKHLYAFNIASPMVHIVLLTVCIPLYGIWGAVIARLIGRIASIAIMMILLGDISNKSSAQAAASAL